MITPAFGPVDAANPDLAAANMSVFAKQVTAQAEVEGQTRGYTPQVGEPVRDESLDADGRYGWVLPLNGVQVQVLMPGVALDVLRGLGNDVPALLVGGEWSWWSDAVCLAVPVPDAGRL